MVLRSDVIKFRRLYVYLSERWELSIACFLRNLVGEKRKIVYEIFERFYYR